MSIESGPSRRVRRRRRHHPYNPFGGAISDASKLPIACLTLLAHLQTISHLQCQGVCSAQAGAIVRAMSATALAWERERTAKRRRPLRSLDRRLLNEFIPPVRAILMSPPVKMTSVPSTSAMPVPLVEMVGRRPNGRVQERTITIIGFHHVRSCATECEHAGLVAGDLARRWCGGDRRHDCRYIRRRGVM